jgi:hypothetical protein
MSCIFLMLAVVLSGNLACSKDKADTKESHPSPGVEVAPAASKETVLSAAEYVFDSKYDAEKQPTGTKHIRIEAVDAPDEGGDGTFDLVMDGVEMDQATMQMSVFGRLSTKKNGTSIIRKGFRYSFATADAELAIEQPAQAEKGIDLSQLTIHADAEGSSDITVAGSPSRPVEYAGLRFNVQAVCGVTNAGVVTVDRAGVDVTDTKGARWVSAGSPATFRSVSKGP